MDSRPVVFRSKTFRMKQARERRKEMRLRKKRREEELSQNTDHSPLTTHHLPKAILSFTFERSAAVEPALLDRLQHARRSAGLVISTPSALKSAVLKFLELARDLAKQVLKYKYK